MSWSQAPSSRSSGFAPRMARIGLSLLLGIILACAFTLREDADLKSSLNVGDFPGFYVLSWIMQHGTPARLYEPGYQKEIENQIWPAFSGQFYMSVYPPYTAMVLAPLAKLGPQAARHVWNFFSCLLLFIAVLTAGRQTRFIKDHPFASLGILLSFAPMLAGILGGQITALSLFVAAGAAALIFTSIHRNAAFPEFLAGGLIGLWLLKPQFGALAGLFLLFSPFRLAFAGFLFIGALFYLAPAAGFGFDWPLWWIESVRDFSFQNYISNATEQVSIFGAFHVLGEQARSSWVSGLFFYFSIAASVFVFLSVVQQMRHIAKLKSHHLKARAASDSMFLMASAVCLLSPQTLFYDLSLPAFCAFRLLDFEDWREAVRLFFILIVSAILVIFRDMFPFPLLAVFNLAFFVMAAKRSASTVI